MRSRHVHDPDFSAKRGCLGAGSGFAAVRPDHCRCPGRAISLVSLPGATAVAAFVAFIATSPWRDTHQIGRRRAAALRTGRTASSPLRPAPVARDRARLSWRPAPDRVGGDSLSDGRALEIGPDDQRTRI